MRNRRKFYGYLALVVALSEVLLILLSWLITAAMPDIPLRSLLSSEGIRWFFGHIVENISTPYLVWLLLLSVGYGAVMKCGISNIKIPLTLRQRFAVQLVVAELCVIVAVMMLLTMLPHATLISVTGHLFPSSFSQSIIPVLAFSLSFLSLSYAQACGEIKRIEDAFDLLTCGIQRAAPLFIIYLLVAQLYASVVFVFYLY